LDKFNEEAIERNTVAAKSFAAPPAKNLQKLFPGHHVIKTCSKFHQKYFGA
jgi:hypothetical protein